MIFSVLWILLWLYTRNDMSISSGWRKVWKILAIIGTIQIIVSLMALAARSEGMI